MFDEPDDFPPNRLGLDAGLMVVNFDHLAILERILDLSTTCAYTDEIEQRGFCQSYFWVLVLPASAVAQPSIQTHAFFPTSSLKLPPLPFPAQQPFA